MTTEQNFSSHPVLRSNVGVIHQKKVWGTDRNDQALIITQHREFVARAWFGNFYASKEEQVLKRLDAAVEQTMIGGGITSMQTVINNIPYHSTQPIHGATVHADRLKQDEYDYQRVKVSRASI